MVSVMKRILIVDRHEVVRDGVKSIFDAQPGAATFGEASTANDALRLVREQEWDVAVLALSLSDRSGLEVLKDFKQIRPQLPVLVLSGQSEDQYAHRAFKAGAAGYVTKDSPRSELAQAIHKVIEGGKYASAGLVDKLISALERGVDRPPHETLSDREFEVMRWIASGKTGSEISRQLSLSRKTISTYRARILEKMGMKTNAELTHYAIKNGLVD